METNEKTSKATKAQLLKQKLGVLNDIYYTTRNVNLADEDSAVDNYVNMVDNRESLIAELTKVDEKLKMFSDNDKNSSEEDEYSKKIAEIVKKIIYEDEKQKDDVNAIVSSIKENITQIKKSKDMKKIYEYDLYLTDSSGRGFDSSN
ncbi:MAG: hypothetical protein FWE29_06250 [Defluviitaleaceae bacterium]|nr:hypothetical protein [Defluviitaleaceae bacterium]